jgi:hypothetical protein
MAQRSEEAVRTGLARVAGVAGVAHWSGQGRALGVAHWCGQCRPWPVARAAPPPRSGGLCGRTPTRGRTAVADRGDGRWGRAAHWSGHVRLSHWSGQCLRGWQGLQAHRALVWPGSLPGHVRLGPPSGPSGHLPPIASRSGEEIAPSRTGLASVSGAGRVSKPIAHWSGQGLYRSRRRQLGARRALVWPCAPLLGVAHWCGQCRPWPGDRAAPPPRSDALCGGTSTRGRTAVADRGDGRWGRAAHWSGHVRLSPFGHVRIGPPSGPSGHLPPIASRSGEEIAPSRTGLASVSGAGRVSKPIAHWSGQGLYRSRRRQLGARRALVWPCASLGEEIAPPRTGLASVFGAGPHPALRATFPQSLRDRGKR